MECFKCHHSWCLHNTVFFSPCALPFSVTVSRILVLKLLLLKEAG